MNLQAANRIADAEMDRRVLHALETAPRIDVPADFAARVARQLPACRPASLTVTHYGRSAVLLGMIFTLGILIALTLHNGRHATFGLAESLLLTQFLVLTVWISVRYHGVR
jgi:hypothetical protein